MRAFLSEFFRDVDRSRTVIVMDEERMERPRQYEVMPRRLMLIVGALIAVGVTTLLSLVIFTPLREWIPGYGTNEIRQEARRTQLRLAALEDSLQAQLLFPDHMRRLVTGQLDSSAYSARPSQTPLLSESRAFVDVAGDEVSDNWADHAQPAIPLDVLPATVGDSPLPLPQIDTRYITSLRFPVLPPVSGFVTRGFLPQTNHYAVDIAVEEGTLVRSVGDGYVIFADWTHAGGHSIVVQHADGFVSAYKHNQQLLKRVGDRVRAQEAIAASGNTGEITTGPHVHFELWHHGLAQDPRTYVVGW